MNELPLESCLDALAGGASLEVCLARFPEQRRELEPLLRAALQLQSVRTVTAPADFRLAARQRLLAQGATSAQPRPTLRPKLAALGAGLAASLRRPLAAPILMRVALLVIVVLIGASATSYAAQAALPGSPLYGAKRLGEQVQMRLATDPLAYRLDLAQRRLEEAEALQDRSRSQLVPVVLKDYQETMAAWEVVRGAVKAEERTGIEKQLLAQLTLLGKMAERAPVEQLEIFKGSQAAAERAMQELQIPASVPPPTATSTPQPSATPGSGFGVPAGPTGTPTPGHEKRIPTVAATATPASPTPDSESHVGPEHTPTTEGEGMTPTRPPRGEGRPGPAHTPELTPARDGGHGTPAPTREPEGGHGTPAPTREPDGGHGTPAPTREPEDGHDTAGPTGEPEGRHGTPGPGSGPGAPDQPPGPSSEHGAPDHMSEPDSGAGGT